MVGEAGLQTIDTPQVPVGRFVIVGTQFNQILDKVLEMGQEGGYGLGPTVVELETKCSRPNLRCVCRFEFQALNEVLTDNPEIRFK